MSNISKSPVIDNEGNVFFVTGKSLCTAHDKSSNAGIIVEIFASRTLQFLTSFFNIMEHNCDGIAFIEYMADEKTAGKIQLGAEYYPSGKSYGMMHQVPQAPEYVRKMA